jgi:S1-C subfamily serine protease
MYRPPFGRLATSAAGTAGVVLLAACSLNTTNGPKAATSPTPRPAATIPAGEASPPVAAGGTGIDAIKVAAAVLPSTAEIIVQTSSGSALGSGFVVAHDASVSYLVTNNHVVSGARSVVVLMNDGRHWTAQVKGTDTFEDVAVVSVPDTTLPLVQFGDSTKLAVGQAVMAVGSPEGNQGSVTLGILSALHRTLTNVGGGTTTQGENLPDVMQTDAAINPGNSGGPLVDATGQVVGINTAGDSQANNIGYAIPSSIAKRVADDLIAGRTAGHPYMGICVTDLAAALAKPNAAPVEGYGSVVTGTVPGGPAAQAGLKTGDVIENVAGIDLNNGNTLGGVLQLHAPNESIPVTALRSGTKTSLTVKLGDFPATPGRCQ